MLYLYAWEVRKSRRYLRIQTKTPTNTYLSGTTNILRSFFFMMDTNKLFRTFRWRLFAKYRKVDNWRHLSNLNNIMPTMAYLTTEANFLQILLNHESQPRMITDYVQKADCYIGGWNFRLIYTPNSRIWKINCININDNRYRINILTISPLNCKYW